MNGQLDPDLTGLSIREKVQRFYDIGSPIYLQALGVHIHDGYYLTGKETRAEAQENLVRFLAEKAVIRKGSRILDVGSGIGGSSIWLAKNLAAQTVGITISPVQVEMAKRLAREQNLNLSYLLMNAENMSFTQQFDYVWVLAALTHLQDQENFFRSAFKLLVNKGRILIYDWTAAEDITDLSQDRDIQLFIEGMVLARIYSANTYLTWLINSGYRIVYTEDITARTLKTWESPFSIFKERRILKLAYRLHIDDWHEILTFLKGIRAIRTAIRRNKIRSMVMVAEKIML